MADWLLDASGEDKPPSPPAAAPQFRWAADVRQRHPDLIALSKPVAPARLIAELRRLMGKLGGAPAQPAAH